MVIVVMETYVRQKKNRLHERAERIQIALSKVIGGENKFLILWSYLPPMPEKPEELGKDCPELEDLV